MELDFEKTIQENVGILHKLCKVYTHNLDEYEDLFQEMLIQVWRSLERFRGDSKISTWIYRVSINTALNFRAKFHRSKMKFEPLGEKLFIQPEIDHRKDEQLQKLYVAIRGLKPIDRAIVTLHLDENSYEDISEILGISKTNVATRLMRLKRKLIDKFNENE